MSRTKPSTSRGNLFAALEAHKTIEWQVHPITKILSFTACSKFPIITLALSAANLIKLDKGMFSF